MISDAPQECRLCRPWEGEVVAFVPSAVGTHSGANLRGSGTVTVRVAHTLAQAVAAGFQHPNAILGDQRCTVLGGLENAARSWYDGPSVHVTTARGNRLTVSPGHPVLTTGGWVRADDLTEGSQVLSRPSREGASLTSVAVEHLHDVPARFEQIFDAATATGLRASGTPAADDFHGDGRFYQGQVDVVWTDRGLLAVGDARCIEHGAQLSLVGADVQAPLLTSSGTLLAGLDGVGRPVGRPLPDRHAAGLEASAQGRVADAIDPGEVLAGLACGVAADEIVHVERDWYRGHCYDLQTTTGAYLTDGILVHNCRHAVSLYQVGITRPLTHTADPGGDELRQKQRYLERRVRAAKREQAAALDEPARRAAATKVRARQAVLREHVTQHNLKNLAYRTSITRAT
ncbi:hypothetical protein GUJ16_12285 [Enterococcus hirae]|nr:hypothetical protein [Enterococcus hirae]